MAANDTLKRTRVNASFGRRRGRRPRGAARREDAADQAAAALQEHAGRSRSTPSPTTTPTAPTGPGTGWSSASIPARISMRRSTGSPARTITDGTTDKLPVQKLVAPVNVIDCSKETAADEDFLLTADGVKAWEKQHGAIEQGRVGGDAHRLVPAQPQRGGVPERQGQHAPFAGPDGRLHRISDRQGHRRLGHGDGRHRRRQGRARSIRPIRRTTSSTRTTASALRASPTSTSCRRRARS